MLEGLQHGAHLQRRSSELLESFSRTTVNLALVHTVFWFVLGRMRKTTPRYRLLPFGASLCLVLSYCPVAGAADEWPQFRGPAGDGTAQAVGLPDAPSEGAGVVWKTAIHGKAWSSPVKAIRLRLISRSTSSCIR